jgi:choline dehydrogenase
MTVPQFDHVVVGSGSAGSVMARRLVDAGRRVLLLEAGPDDDFAPIHDNARCNEVVGSHVMPDYYTTPQPHAAGRQLWWPRGATLGGSSAVNGMVWVRGAASDFDQWAAGGADGWDWASVLPAFRALESFEGGASETRGGSGPLPITRFAEPTAVAQAYMHAWEGLGLPLNPDYNSGDLWGAGYTQWNIVGGNRVSAWRAFGEPILTAPNFQVETSARVRQLKIGKLRVVGVRYLKDDVLHEADADQSVILCAGAMMTPHLLMCSGIGPAQHLEEIGVRVLVDSPGVGANLQDHLSMSVLVRSPRAVPARQGSGLEVQSFWKSHDGATSPDMQQVLRNSNLAPDGYDSPEHGFTLMAGVVRILSRGRITLASADPDVLPYFDPCAFVERHDIEVAVASVELMREIAHRPELSEWVAQEVAPGPGVTTAAQLEAYVRRAAQTYFHPVGTARMGVDAEAVVDPRTLGVHGIEGLHVADASVMPTITSGNTNAPAMMIGERGAELLLARD